MAVYSENSVSSAVTTKQEEQARHTQLAKKPLKCSDRLGMVRRNLVLDDQMACPYCPQVATIEPGMLRIVEVMYDSPLSNPTETHEGEFIVLRNATGITISLESVHLAYTGGFRTFSSGDKLGPYQWAIIPRLTGSSPSSFASLYGLTGYDSDPDVEWFWDNSLTLPDAGGIVRIFDYTGGVATVLDEVNFGGSGIVASNGSYCATACNTAQSVQLDDFLTSPPGDFDAGDWAGAVVSGYGQQGMAAFVLSSTYERALGHREYEMKDHLGNVRAVVSDRKMSDINGGTSLPELFRAEVLVMRDYYPFGMEMPGTVYSLGDYRYGFNGMERDDEVKGSGDSYDFGARMYDPRVGRWWSRDPLEGKYAPNSTYGFARVNPIFNVDKDGAEGVPYIKGGRIFIAITLAYVSDGTSASLTLSEAKTIENAFLAGWAQAYGKTVTFQGKKYEFGGIDLTMVAGGSEEDVNKLRDAKFGVNKLAKNSVDWFETNRPLGVIASTIAEGARTTTENTIYIKEGILENAILENDASKIQDISVDETGHLMGTVHPWDNPNLAPLWYAQNEYLRDMARREIGLDNPIGFWNLVGGKFKFQIQEQQGKGLIGPNVRLGALEFGIKDPETGSFKINDDDVQNIFDSDNIKKGD